MLPVCTACEGLLPPNKKITLLTKGDFLRNAD